jgi:hypothetical protein
LTSDERLRAVADLGFTQRQAGFLVTVMLHAGVCLARQYCAYGSITYGQKAVDFFRSLLSRGYATARPAGNQNTRLFHLHHKRLYRAIGEPDNRHRRPTTLPRAVERLMLLDAVLADRDRTWLATEWEKLAHFTLTHQVPRHDLPRLVFRADDAETVRFFPDKLPIAVDADGRTYVFLYLVTRAMPIEFRAFLERHAELLRSVPGWRLRLLVPRHFRDAIPLYKAAFHEQLGTPLRPIVLDELRWYFYQRGRIRLSADVRFDHAARAFAAPRFQVLYRAWLEHGDPVLDATLSPVLADALSRRTGQLECHVLPHRYLHLLPLVGTA